jgi:carbon monoxide dehydrogenase subunit G
LRLEVSTSISAPPERVWQAIVEVERWHEWTTSITSVEKLEPGELKIGSKARVKQPKLPRTVWTVTSLDPGRSFEWEAKGLGSKTVAWHRAEPEGDGTRATLGIDQQGIFFALTGWYFNKLTRDYVNTELAGLEKRAEGR